MASGSFHSEGTFRAVNSGSFHSEVAFWRRHNMRGLTCELAMGKESLEGKSGVETDVFIVRSWTLAKIEHQLQTLFVGGVFTLLRTVQSDLETVNCKLFFVSFAHVTWFYDQGIGDGGMCRHFQVLWKRLEYTGKSPM